MKLPPPAVACVIEDDELAVGPRLVQLPCRVEGPGDVIATMDQNGRDAG